jgi:hypothetical protein
VIVVGPQPAKSLPGSVPLVPPRAICGEAHQASLAMNSVKSSSNAKEKASAKERRLNFSVFSGGYSAARFICG